MTSDETCTTRYDDFFPLHRYHDDVPQSNNLQGKSNGRLDNVFGNWVVQTFYYWSRFHLLVISEGSETTVQEELVAQPQSGDPVISLSNLFEGAIEMADPNRPDDHLYFSDVGGAIINHILESYGEVSLKVQSTIPDVKYQIWTVALRTPTLEMILENRKYSDGEDFPSSFYISIRTMGHYKDVEQFGMSLWEKLGRNPAEGLDRELYTKITGNDPLVMQQRWRDLALLPIVRGKVSVEMAIEEGADVTSETTYLNTAIKYFEQKDFSKYKQTISSVISGTLGDIMYELPNKEPPEPVPPYQPHAVESVTQMEVIPSEQEIQPAPTIDEVPELETVSETEPAQEVELQEVEEIAPEVEGELQILDETEMENEVDEDDPRKRKLMDKYEKWKGEGFVVKRLDEPLSSMADDVWDVFIRFADDILALQDLQARVSALDSLPIATKEQISDNLNDPDLLFELENLVDVLEDADLSGGPWPDIPGIEFPSLDEGQSTPEMSPLDDEDDLDVTLNLDDDDINVSLDDDDEKSESDEGSDDYDISLDIDDDDIKVDSIFDTSIEEKTETEKKVVSEEKMEKPSAETGKDSEDDISQQDEKPKKRSKRFSKGLRSLLLD